MRRCSTSSWWTILPRSRPSVRRFAACVAALVWAWATGVAGTLGKNCEHPPAEPSDLSLTVYTPTVGWAALNYHHVYRRPRGMFFSLKDRGEMVRRRPISGQ